MTDSLDCADAAKFVPCGRTKPLRVVRSRPLVDWRGVYEPDSGRPLKSAEESREDADVEEDGPRDAERYEEPADSAEEEEELG